MVQTTLEKVISSLCCCPNLLLSLLSGNRNSEYQKQKSPIDAIYGDMNYNNDEMSVVDLTFEEEDELSSSSNATSNSSVPDIVAFNPLQHQVSPKFMNYFKSTHRTDRNEVDHTTSMELKDASLQDLKTKILSDDELQIILDKLNTLAFDEDRVTTVEELIQQSNMVLNCQQAQELLSNIQFSTKRIKCLEIMLSNIHDLRSGYKSLIRSMHSEGDRRMVGDKIKQEMKKRNAVTQQESKSKTR